MSTRKINYRPLSIRKIRRNEQPPLSGRRPSGPRRRGQPPPPPCCAPARHPPTRPEWASHPRQSRPQLLRPPLAGAGASPARSEKAPTLEPVGRARSISGRREVSSGQTTRADLAVNLFDYNDIRSCHAPPGDVPPPVQLARQRTRSANLSPPAKAPPRGHPGPAEYPLPRVHACTRPDPSRGRVARLGLTPAHLGPIVAPSCLGAHWFRPERSARGGMPRTVRWPR